MPATEYEQKVKQVLDSLGIRMEYITRMRLPFHAEPQDLVIAETDVTGREYRMTPQAAAAWREMRQAARRDDVLLHIVSAFRTLDDQIRIIRNKLDRGMPIETILTLSAPPGYSEHHSGRAIDINTPGCRATEEEFEDTDAFRWLTLHAARFGFTLSYPRNNQLGFIYEPWHWYFGPAAGQET